MTPTLIAPLQWVYGAVVRAKNARFDRTTAQRLQWPVVSIGNLSVGGSGKTPLVICLAALLQENGWQPDVLSRGYGRAGTMPEWVDPAGTAMQFGDEPLLIARAAGVPVFVGASRYQAGVLAEAASKTRRLPARPIHLLDDGFQHRQLARTVDIVVVHRSDLQTSLLPAGRLREPLSSLKRADVIVLRQEDAELEAALREYVRSACVFWKVRRRLAVPVALKRAVAFCAIARPKEFYAGLEAEGLSLLHRLSFRDHHRYSVVDIDRLASLGTGCDGFVTTAKDEVKLDAALQARLARVAPLYTAQLTVELEDESAVLRQLSARLQI